jgi:hypothetical protein
MNRNFKSIRLSKLKGCDMLVIKALIKYVVYSGLFGIDDKAHNIRSSKNRNIMTAFRTLINFASYRIRIRTKK